jgi:hypothetical protein
MYESLSVATVGVPTPGPSAWAAGTRPARQSAATNAAPARRWDMTLLIVLLCARRVERTEPPLERAQAIERVP